MTAQDPRPFWHDRHFVLLLLAIIVEAIVLLAAVFSLAIPKPEAWIAAALLCFFASFL